VRLADVGWTAETATTAVFARILTELGYETQTTVLSVPVTFEALKNGDMDVFLGNWIPAQSAMLKPFTDEKSIEVVRDNLTGAKYTLAVPGYLHDAGLRDFKDIARFRKSWGHRFTASSPATTAMARARDDPQERVRARRVPADRVERAGHAGRRRASRARQETGRVPGLGAAPDEHPFRHAIPDRRRRDLRAGLRRGNRTQLDAQGLFTAVPNVGRLLANMSFSVDLENEWMDANPGQNRFESPTWRRSGLAGARNSCSVGSRASMPSTAIRHWKPLAVAGPSHKTSAFERYITQRKIPVGDTMTRFVDYTKKNARGFFDAITLTLSGSILAVDTLLRSLPAPALIAVLRCWRGCCAARSDWRYLSSCRCCSS
jgi:glycine betaine/proline transport system substrate-binding protein